MTGQRAATRPENGGGPQGEGAGQNTHQRCPAYQPDPCRPFTDDEPPPAPAPAPAPPAPPRGTITDLGQAIDAAQIWSLDHIRATVALAQWLPFLEAGGPQPSAAKAVAHAVATMTAGRAWLDHILAELTSAVDRIEGRA